MFRPPGSGFGGHSNRNAESPRLDTSSQRSKKCYTQHNNSLDECKPVAFLSTQNGQL